MPYSSHCIESWFSCLAEMSLHNDILAWFIDKPELIITLSVTNNYQCKQ